MKPKPFWSLNHFTFPVAMRAAPFPKQSESVTTGGPRRRTAVMRYKLPQSPPDTQSFLLLSMGKIARTHHFFGLFTIGPAQVPRRKPDTTGSTIASGHLAV